jgi:hypothetical protein
MPQAAVASDLHESLYIHGNRLAQIPFNHPIPLYDIAHPHNLVFGEIFYLGVDIYESFLADLGRPALSNSIDIGQTDLNPLAQRQIDSRNSSQCVPPWSSLSLLVFGIGATNMNDSLAPNHLAFIAYLFHRCPYLHVLTPKICDLFVPVYYAPTRQVIWGQLNENLVPWQNTNKIFAHLSRDMGQHHMLVLELNPEHGIWKSLNHRANNLYRILFRHKFSAAARQSQGELRFI